MDNLELKQVTLAFIHKVHDDLEELMNALPESQKNARGTLDDWSASDSLTHITFWNNHLIRQVEAAQKGEPVPSAGDYYLILNDGVFIRNADKNFETAFSEEKASFEKALDLLEKMDADDLANPKHFEFTNNRSILDAALSTFGWHLTSHISDFYVQQGQMENAIAVQEAHAEQLSSSPWKANAVYNLACFYSLQGMKEKALENLKIAFKERPELVEWSKQDPDMNPMRDDPAFQALLDKK